MARRGDDPLTAVRPPLARELSAGGLVYRRRGGRWTVVLAARRPPGRDVLVWGIPKGHVEPGERVVDAALREVREETGMLATAERPLGDVTYWYARRDPDGRPVRVLKRVRFYLMRWRGGRFADRDAEMDAVRWFALDAAEARVAFANERALLRRARALLEGGKP
ncbi:MAG TPA: NUDIX domain-containing protein [Candidatus Binatia bacterium]|nr:NUDIX domain-containing protein [Candidatus Binatia bacterium]